MKTIVAGSRCVTSYAIVEKVIRECGWTPTEIVSGGAPGVDWLAEVYAKKNGIPFKLFPADWKAHGRAAGPIRNREMAAYGDILLAVWDGHNRGTRNMIQEALKVGDRVVIICMED